MPGSDGCCAAEYTNRWASDARLALGGLISVRHSFFGRNAFVSFPTCDPPLKERHQHFRNARTTTRQKAKLTTAFVNLLGERLDRRAIADFIHYPGILAPGQATKELSTRR
jgi:hypothetical protein